MPGYTAESSLYQTRQFYRKGTGRSSIKTSDTVVAQLDCTATCTLEYTACLAGCGIFACVPGCAYAFYNCQSGCSGSGGGGGGPGPNPRCGCPPGTVCQGGCVKEPCVGLICNGDCVSGSLKGSSPFATVPTPRSPISPDCAAGRRLCP